MNTLLNAENFVVLLSLTIVILLVQKTNPIITDLAIKWTVFTKTSSIPKAANVVFNNTSETKSKSTLDAENKKKDFDRMFAIPAYARKQMNINYPISLYL